MASGFVKIHRLVLLFSLFGRSLELIPEGDWTELASTIALSSPQMRERAAAIFFSIRSMSSLHQLLLGRDLALAKAKKESGLDLPPLESANVLPDVKHGVSAQP